MLRVSLLDYSTAATRKRKTANQEQTIHDHVVQLRATNRWFW